MSLRPWWLLVFVVICYFGVFALSPQFFPIVGVNHYGVWFLDSFAILASNDALARGLDPYLPNALDYFNRPHVYSHWWLGLGKLGLTRADNFWLGSLLALMFFVAVLVRLRPREPREVVWYGAILCAAPLVLALERANNDLVVFVLLAPVVPCLLHPNRWMRLLPVALIALTAGLKFYPAIAGLILLAGRDLREVRGRLVIAVVVLGLVGVSLAPDLAQFSGLAPKAKGLMTFGSVQLLEAFGLSGRPATLVGLVIGGVVVVGFLRWRAFVDWEFPEDYRADWLAFLLGGALLAGCFFTGTNFGYRWVFAIWLAPLLWRLPRDSRAPVQIRRLAALTAALLIWGLWADGAASALLAQLGGIVPTATLVQWADRFVLIEQPLLWLFFSALLGWLTHFTSGALRLLAKAPAVKPS